MKLLMMQFSPASYSVFIPGPNILLNALNLEVSLRAMLPRILPVEHFFNLKDLRPIECIQAGPIKK
jgi:hypothetical protein